MTDSLRELVRSVLAEVLELPPADIVDSADFYDELGVDSLEKLTIIDAVERRTGIRLEESEARTANSVDALVAAAARRRVP